VLEVVQESALVDRLVVDPGDQPARVVLTGRRRAVGVQRLGRLLRERLAVQVALPLVVLLLVLRAPKLVEPRGHRRFLFAEPCRLRAVAGDGRADKTGEDNADQHEREQADAPRASLRRTLLRELRFPALLLALSLGQLGFRHGCTVLLVQG
jgi:hypothetical protein